MYEFLVSYQFKYSSLAVCIIITCSLAALFGIYFRRASFINYNVIFTHPISVQLYKTSPFCDILCPESLQISRVIHVQVYGLYDFVSQFGMIL